MKWSFGIVTVILTIVFSYMAVQNNKMAREIAVREFGLKQTKNQSTKVDFNDSFEQKWKNSKKEFGKEWDNFGK